MKASGHPFTRLFLATLAALTAACDGGPAEPVPPPPPPSTLSATPSSHTEVLVSWAAPAAEVQEFRVERAADGAAFVQVATVAGNVFTYRDVGLTPSTAYQYRVRACGEGGCSPYATTTVTTLAVLEITTDSLPDGVRGEAYSVGLNATGGIPGYVWTVLSGSLPAGMSLSELGILSGFPETAQTAVFVVRVRSQDGQTASKEFSIRVVESAGGTGVTIGTARLPPALLDAPYTVALEASGGDGGVYAWSVVSGSLPPGLSLGAGGVFSGFPSSAGAFAFTVAVTSGGSTDQKTFALDVIPDETTGFDVTAFEVSPVPANIRPHLVAAVARWQRVITGDLGNVHIPRSFFSSTFCGGFGELVNGTTVDDLIVMIDISPIDGAGQILGQSAPCGLRNTSRLPFVGFLTLDSDDLAPLAGTQTLTDVIFHEIAHILGFGTLWGARQLILDGGTSNPRFVGVQAVAEYGSLGGSGQVPVEGSGGVGTADAHWRESVFRTEILTGFSERVGTPMPLSRVSIASMADLGYAVDLGQADPFTLPSLVRAPTPPFDPLGYDVILAGPVRYLPEMETRR